jgi:exopolyphosphatase/guanosine-5'-triphosphate,3'-diphosphate pyrophosphatase
MRLAAIDLGSNTIRLLVADVDPVVGLRAVHGEQVVARLGEGLARTGRLRPEAMARALSVVRTYCERARALGADHVRVVATAAVRQAENREELVGRLAVEPHVAVRVVSGDEEARLTVLGVMWGAMSGARGGHPGGDARVAVLDIGGGSTEVVVAAGGTVLGGVSVSLGVVALAERFFHTDPVDWAEYAACAGHVARRLELEAWPAIRPLAPVGLVGTAGTITTVAALDLDLETYDPGRVQGHRLSAATIAALRDRLGAMPVADRARLPCLEPGRADLIVPGIAIVEGALAGLGMAALTVSDTGLREGVLLEAAGWVPRTADIVRGAREAPAP